MDHGEAAFESSVESVFGRELFFGCARLENGLGIFDVDVAEVGVPVLVGDVCCVREFSFCESGVDLFDSSGKFVQDPPLCEGLFVTLGSGSIWSEGIIKLSENIFGGLVDLVAETTVAMHDTNIKTDIATYKGLARPQRNAGSFRDRTSSIVRD